MPKLTVALKERSYDILIEAGLIERTGRLLAELGVSGKVFVITDDNVGSLYGGTIEESLDRAGIPAVLIKVPAGERSKSLETARALYEKLIEGEADRGSWIVALGGGVVGDLAGFVAATYMRGVPYVQIPTTLLAQADSSIGGKVGVDLPEGKNLVGAFCQPELVIMDLATLRTLPKRELRCGLAEIVKHSIIRDKKLFERLEKNYQALLELEMSELEKTLLISCRIKAGVVEEDEEESGVRAVLNFGHTTAHSLEALSGYDKYLHGEAVAVGMACAALLSARMGYIGDEESQRIIRLIESCGLRTSYEGIAPGEIFSGMMMDKKNRNRQICWVLLKGIGDAVINQSVPDQVAKDVLEERAR